MSSIITEPSAHTPIRAEKPAIYPALRDDTEFLDLNEVANLLRLSKISIHRLVAKQILPAYQVSRKLLFKRQEIIECLEKYKKA